MTTPLGYRSPVATKIERMSHWSAGSAVSNRGMEGAMESGERAAFEVLGLV